MGRPAGIPHSPQTRAAISAGLQKAYAEGRIVKRQRSGYRPPPEFLSMYDDLRLKVGPTEARRLVEDHAAVMARRKV